MKKSSLVVFLALGFILGSSYCLAASEPIKLPTVKDPSQDISLLKEARHSLKQAHEFLLNSQMENGSWKNEPAITYLVLYSFLLYPTYIPDGRTEAALRQGFAFLETFVKPDGGIYRKEYRNYTTAVCLLAFAESKGENNFIISGIY